MSGEPSPVRLLVFTGAAEWGGAEIVLGHLLEALHPRFEVRVLGTDPDVVRRVAARRPGTSWALVPTIAGRRDLRSMLAHRHAIAAARPDVVHVNLPAPFAEQYTVLAAVSLRTPVVVVEHLPMAMRSRSGALLKRLTSRRLAAHLAVGSGAAREVERLCGLAPGSVRPMPNGVPALDPPPVGAARAVGDQLVVGGVGRLHEQKGFDVLVRAAAMVPGTRIVLVGDGPERGSLERLAADLGVRLTVTGWTQDARSYLTTFDVVAMPSRFEGLPLVLLEAMLAQRPVVATAVGSVLDAVHDGGTGLVVPVDDVGALAAALGRLAADPALCRRLGRAGGDVARARFTAPAMAREYERVYDGLVRRS